MVKIITTDNGQQYQTAGFGKTAGAILAGSAASSVLTFASQSVSLKCIGKMQKLAQNCDTVHLQDGIDRSFFRANLPAKGANIVNVVTPNHSYTLIEHLQELLNNKNVTLAELHPENPKLVETVEKSFPKILRNSFLGKIYMENIIASVEGGMNAFYSPKQKM